MLPSTIIRLATTIHLLNGSVPKHRILSGAKAQCFWVSSGTAKALPFQRPILRWLLVAVQQHSLDLLFTDGAIKELIVFEVDLNERRALREGALNERF